MSHISTLEGVALTNEASIKKAAEELGGTATAATTVKQYGGNTITDCAWSVDLPGVKYPIAITKDGEVKHDLYRATDEGRSNLPEFIQRYQTADVIRGIKGSRVGFRKITKAPTIDAEGYMTTEVEILV